MLFRFQGCTQGNTYSGSTGKTTTVNGVYNTKVDVNLAQTSCTSAGAAGTWSMSATWPKITFYADVDIYPVTGGDIGVFVQLTVSNMVVKSQGNYGYNVTASQMCVTAMDATTSSITVSSVSATVGVTGSAGTPFNKLASKVQSQLLAAGPKITSSLNSAMAKKVGKCKTLGTTAPPRAPMPPRSPRAGGR